MLALREMKKRKISEEEFVRLYQTQGTEAAASAAGIKSTAAKEWRRKIEANTGQRIESGNLNRPGVRVDSGFVKRIALDLQEGIILIGSDHHYWPDKITTAHRAFVQFCHQMNPVVVIANGDVFDGAKVSRHPPIGWAKPPKVIEELEACQERLHEILMASKEARHLWTGGNHDARFENRLAMNASEFEGVKGFRLADHFPLWEFCTSVWVNGNVAIKHRYKGGVHAAHNNTVNAGISIVTGHLHSLKVTPFNDYRGARWGVDTGTMAEPDDEQFDYAEDNPQNHRSGFVVLTFAKGRLLWPEIVHVIEEGKVSFRGEVISV